MAEDVWISKIWTLLFTWKDLMNGHIQLCLLFSFDSPIISKQYIDTSEELVCHWFPEICYTYTLDGTHLLTSLMGIPPTPQVHSGLHITVKVPLWSFNDQSICLLSSLNNRKGGLWRIYKKRKNPRIPPLDSQNNTVCVLLVNRKGIHDPVQVWGSEVSCFKESHNISLCTDHTNGNILQG